MRAATISTVRVSSTPTLASHKRFYLDPGERHRYMELRLESYNTFNHTQFGAPGTNINSSTFGRILSAASGRTVQLGAKIYF